MGVGRRLRQAREARGLPVAEVAARTKIPPRQVAALEAEEYDKLPGGIFVRGHIRAMATLVGLDPVELTEHFEDETSPPPVMSAQPRPEHEPDAGPRLRMAMEPGESRPNGHLIAALVIVVSIVLALAWWGRDRDAPPSSRNGAAPPAAAASLAAVDTGPRALGTSGTLDGSGSAAAGAVALSFQAQRVCWLSLTVDGQRVAYRMLQEGETVTARMHDRALVRTGDAGALLLSMGGGPARAMGAPGAVRNVELTPASYERLPGR